MSYRISLPIRSDKKSDGMIFHMDFYTSLQTNEDRLLNYSNYRSILNQFVSPYSPAAARRRGTYVDILAGNRSAPTQQ